MISANDCDIVVTFDTAANLNYRIERKLSAADAGWQSISGVNDLTPSSNGSAQFIHPGGANLDRAFYRVELMVP